MENFYTSYIKIVNERKYYFVKKYTRFPEFKNVGDVLENYGMHTDFNKACNIAFVFDETIRQTLWEEAEATAPAWEPPVAMQASPVVTKTRTRRKMYRRTDLVKRVTVFIQSSWKKYLVPQHA